MSEPATYTCDVCGFQAGELAVVVEHLRVEHGITDTAEVGSIEQAEGRLVLRSGADVTEIDLNAWLREQLGSTEPGPGTEEGSVSYADYMNTRHGSHSQYGPFQLGQRIAVKIVASTWKNEHGKWWAAYYGDGAKSSDEVADHGVKLPRELAEALFPQIVAAGCEWWD